MNDLCAALNQPPEIVAAWVLNIKMLMDKGLAMDEALKKSIEINTSIINASHKISADTNVKKMCVDYFLFLTS